MARVIGSPPMSKGKHRPCNSLSSSWFWFDAVFGVSITLYVESRARTRLGRNEGRGWRDCTNMSNTRRCVGASLCAAQESA